MSKILHFFIAGLVVTNLQVARAQEPVELAQQALEAFLEDWN